jgi:hypothetical protein
MASWCAVADLPPACCDGDLLRAELGVAAMHLAVAGFVAVWHGMAGDVVDLLPPGADVSIVALQAAKGRLEVDDGGALVGIHGLTLRSTRHRFVHDGRSHHTWCAFDSIGIPAAPGNRRDRAHQVPDV